MDILTLLRWCVIFLGFNLFVSCFILVVLSMLFMLFKTHLFTEAKQIEYSGTDKDTIND